MSFSVYKGQHKTSLILCFSSIFDPLQFWRNWKKDAYYNNALLFDTRAMMVFRALSPFVITEVVSQ